MNEHDLLWDILPDGLCDYFKIESYEKTKEVFTIVLVEKDLVPTDLPEEYRGKKIINTVLKPITVESFPLKCRRCELVLKRRLWQFEGIQEMYKRPLKLCFLETKLEKEFASFLKGKDRK